MTHADVQISLHLLTASFCQFSASQLSRLCDQWGTVMVVKISHKICSSDANLWQWHCLFMYMNILNIAELLLNFKSLIHWNFMKSFSDHLLQWGQPPIHVNVWGQQTCAGWIHLIYLFFTWHVHFNIPVHSLQTRKKKRKTFYIL